MDCREEKAISNTTPFRDIWHRIDQWLWNICSTVHCYFPDRLVLWLRTRDTLRYLSHTIVEHNPALDHLAEYALVILVLHTYRHSDHCDLFMEQDTEMNQHVRDF